VSFDNGDPCCTDLSVSIIQRAIEDSVATVITTVDVGADGNYLFNNVIPGQEVLFIMLGENSQKILV
jgi:hypothetical protein